jgi:glycosyltransferase involved in cell wall biosynthesis
MKRVIVQVVQHLQPGGIENLALEMQRFSDSGDEVHIVSLEGNMKSFARQWPMLEERKGFLHFMDKQPGIQWKLIRQLSALFTQLQADVIHSHHIGPLLYAGMAARLAKIGIVHTEHDAWHLQNKRRRYLETLLLRTISPILVADANYVAAELRQLLPGLQPYVIPNGIDLQRFTPGRQDLAREYLGLPKKVKIVGCAARLQSVKGHDVLLDSLFRLPAEIHLALAGTGPMEAALRKQVKELDLSSRVHFLGRVDDMPQFYRAIDLFCMASHNEGLPLSPLEAQACNTAVVLTNVGGCKEAVCPRTGSLVRAGDSSALAGRIDWHLNHRNRVRDVPREFVQRGKSLTDMVAAYGKLMSQGG